MSFETLRQEFGKWLKGAQAAHENDATQSTPPPDMYQAYLAARTRTESEAYVWPTFEAWLRSSITHPVSLSEYARMAFEAGRATKARAEAPAPISELN